MDDLDSVLAALLTDEAPSPEVAQALRGREAFGRSLLFANENLTPAANAIRADSQAQLKDEAATRGMLLKRALWMQGKKPVEMPDEDLIAAGESIGIPRKVLGVLPKSQAAAMVANEFARKQKDASRPPPVVKPTPPPKDPRPPPRMSDTTKKEIESTATTAESVARLNDAFRDEYAGEGLAGGIVTGVQKKLGAWAPEDVQRKAAFWADWDKLVNLPERNAIFGASLSAGEKSSWEGARNIKPGSDPKIVRAKLAELLGIVRRKGASLAEAAKAEGYKAEAVDALTRGAFADKATGSPAPGRKRFNPATGKVE